ncbi:MAG: hypothetical protein M1819_007078 [Sarea resinae]|nr:MAG: hypothetical protein M1819_007078 [Sarea resinae]
MADQDADAVASGTSNGEKNDIVIPLQIGGEEVVTETSFELESPSTHKPIWRASTASKADAVRAAEAAQAAFPAWSQMNFCQRRDVFLRAADILERRADELADYMKTETGAEDFFSKFNTNLSVQLLKDAGSRISSIQGSMPMCMEDGSSALVYKEPYGVVLGIAPWNAPYILGFRSVIYALAAGNSTILKGSELAPRCFWAIGSVFAEAGLPKGALNVLIHTRENAAEITTALIEHPAIQKINFTGSTAVGRIVAETAGRNLKPVLLELGGKASAIVLPDADLDKAAEACALGAFIHGGQVCMSTERIIVHASIQEQFRTALLAAVERTSPPNNGPHTLINPSAVQKNHSLISHALSHGADLIHPPSQTHPTPHASPTRMHPTVVQNVTATMNIYHTESFGPSVSLLTASSEAHAVALANDTDYGLTAAVYTRDLGTGLRVARRIDAGAVHVNCGTGTIHDEPCLPHGGVKGSGFGRFNGMVGLDEFLRSKTVTFRGWETE